MASGYKDIAVTSYDTLRFSWWEDGQDIGSNTTTVKWGLYLISSTYGAIYSNPAREWYVNVNGVEYGGSVSVAIGNNETKTLASGSTSIGHNPDGTKTFSYSFSQTFNITFSDVWRGTYSGSGSGTLTPIPREAQFTSEPPNITDETNSVTIYFKNPAGNAVDSLWICIGDRNWGVITPYDKIENKNATSFTYNLTEERKKLLRQATKSDTLEIRYYLKTTINGSDYFDTSDKILTLVNYKPTLIPSVKDIHIPSLQLTGDDTGQTVIKGLNIMEYDIGATAYKEATIVEQYVKCGNIKKTESTGELNYVESNIFEFYVRDSRGNELRRNLELNFVDYTRLTCNQEVHIELVGETEAQVKLTAKGNYYPGSFGAQDNQLWLKYHYSADGGDYSDWVSFSNSEITINEAEHTYTATTTITGLDYDRTYVFVCRASDMPMIIESNEYETKLIPVFDWGENDFNFNVPVSIQGGKVYGAYVLASGNNSGTVNLNDDVSNYDYLEIYFTDNNGVYGGYSKIPTNGTNTINISLSIIEASSMYATYIRRTTYVLKGKTLSPNTTSAGYHSLSQSTVSSSNNSTNYIKILRVVGYK